MYLHLKYASTSDNLNFNVIYFCSYSLCKYFICYILKCFIYAKCLLEGLMEECLAKEYLQTRPCNIQQYFTAVKMLIF